MKKILLLTLALAMCCWVVAGAANENSSLSSKAPEISKSAPIANPSVSNKVPEIAKKAPAADLSTTALGTNPAEKSLSVTAPVANPSILLSGTAPVDELYLQKVAREAALQTPPTITAILLTEGFEGGALPAGWTDVGGYPWLYNNGTYHGPGAPHSGAFTAYFNIWDYAYGTSDDLITPSMDFSAYSTNYILNYWSWHSSGTDSVVVFLDEAGVLTRIHKLPNTTVWTLNSILFSSTSTNGKIHFMGYSNYGNYNLHIDDVEVADAPSVGRCCYGDPTAPSCADNSPAECAALGGTWTAGLTCAGSTCPTYVLGDVCEAPIIIPSIPYTDSRNSCAYTHNYGYSGADVIYRFTLAAPMTLNLDLCGSPTQWDTQLSVWADGNCGTTTYIADADGGCNTTYYLSSIQNLALNAGTYYVMVDGWGVCADYVLDIEEAAEIIVDCPTEGIPEGEPDCGGAYVDNFNGGCNSAPPIFSSIACGDVICGTSGTNTVGRDTDWFRFVVADPSTLTWTATAEFPVLIFIINAGLDNCTDYSIITSATANPMDLATATANVYPGTYYVWVGPSVFSGWPCPLDYVATLTCAPWTPPGTPANDDCLTAEVVSGPYPQTVPGTTLGATVDCPEVLGWTAVWYAIDLPYASNAVSIDFCPTAGAIPTIGIVYYNDCFDCYAYTIWGYGFVTCPSGFTNPVLMATIPGPATIYFPVYTGTGMDFEMIVDVQVPPDAPPNDNCVDVTPVPLNAGTPLQFTGTNVGATVDCPSLGYPEVWHAITTTECMDIAVDWCGTSPAFTNAFIVMTNTCPCGPFIYYNSFDNTSCDGNYTIRYTNVPAGTYYIPVLTNQGQAYGPYTMNVNGVACPPPPGADFQVVAPGSWNGNTCGAFNDCSLRGSEEHIYEITIPANGDWTFSLCNTPVSWDTYLYLGTGSCMGDLASSDDFCGLLSQFTVNGLAAGVYYLTIEGYSTSGCGDYVLDVTGGPPVPVECPPVNTPEGEPTCYDEYVDVTNGGCNSDPNVFGTITDGETICGTSGDYLFGGLNYRDTDWYTLTLTESKIVTVTGKAAFNGALYFLVPGADPDPCGGLSIPYATTITNGVDFTLSATLSAGYYWIFVASTGVGDACGSIYYITLTEETPPPPPVGCVDAEYTNGEYDPAGTGYSSQCDPVYPFASGVADDFVIPGTGTFDVSTVVCWMTFWNGPVFDPANLLGMVVTIYADNAGTPGGKPTSGDPNCLHEELVPGGVISSEFVDPSLITMFQTPEGFWQFETPITPVTVDRGTTYWLEMAPVMSFSVAGQSGWVTTAGITGSSCLQIFELLGIMDWTAPAAVDVAFCVIGPTGPIGCTYVVGDVNNTGVFNGIDVSYGVGYFKGGPVPPYSCDCNGSIWYVAGDVNGSCVFNGIDITYMVVYFKGGAAPIPCAFCPPAALVAPAPVVPSLAPKSIQIGNNQ